MRLELRALGVGRVNGFVVYTYIYNSSYKKTKLLSIVAYDLILKVVHCKKEKQKPYTNKEREMPTRITTTTATKTIIVKHWQ